MVNENIRSFGSLSLLFDDIDDWCGTKPPRVFPPKKKGVRDLLVSIAIHNLADQISDTRIRESIQSQAASLHALAGKQIAG